MPPRRSPRNLDKTTKSNENKKEQNPKRTRPPANNNNGGGSHSDDELDDNWRDQLPNEFRRPKRQRTVPDDEMIDDLARDYVDAYNWWRQQKKELVKNYHEAAIMRDQMVCENCKAAVELDDNLDTSRQENPHVARVFYNKRGDLMGEYSCPSRTYNELFMARVEDLGDEDDENEDDENEDDENEDDENEEDEHDKE